MGRVCGGAKPLTSFLGRKSKKESGFHSLLPGDTPKEQKTSPSSTSERFVHLLAQCKLGTKPLVLEPLEDTLDPNYSTAQGPDFQRRGFEVLQI